MQNRPDGVSQPATSRPISESFLCLFFCALFNKYFQNIYKSQDVSHELFFFIFLLKVSLQMHCDEALRISDAGHTCCSGVSKKISFEVR